LKKKSRKTKSDKLNKIEVLSGKIKILSGKKKD
jgi:hypothetical protein